MRLALISLVLLLATGCVEDFPPGTTIEDLRILAVRAEPPEVAPGEPSALTALVARPGNDLEGVTLDWALCLAPRSQGQSSPVPDACSAPAPDPALLGQPAPGLGPDEAYVLEVPPLEALDPAIVSVPDATGGVYLAVRVVARRRSEEAVAIYRLRLRTGPEPPNTNPDFDDDGVRLGRRELAPDRPVEVEPDSVVTLSARFAAGAEERYVARLSPQDPAAAEAQTEVLQFSWFVDRGIVEPAHTGGAGEFETRWGLPAVDPDAGADGNLAHVWVVLRDNRGGTRWQVGQVRLR